MEIHHAGVRLPRVDRGHHTTIIERNRQAKPPSKALLRADIVAWEHVQTAQSPQRHVLGSPASDPAQFEQFRAYRAVGVKGEGVKVDRAAV